MNYTQPQRSPRALRASLLLLLTSSLILSACATQDQGRNGRPDGPRSERPDGKARNAGVFLNPIAAVFSAMDTNSDRMTSRAELLAGIDQQWLELGGKTSAAYFSQWSVLNLGSTDAMPTFMSFDRDFNGVISQNEFSEQLIGIFDRLDVNADSRISRSELIVSYEAPMGRAKQSGRSGGRPEKGGGDRPPRR